MPATGPLTPDEVTAHAEAVRRTSLTVLPGLLPAGKIDAWNAAFQPLLDQAIGRERDDPNRGPARHYVTLPFDDPWADPEVIDNDAIMAVVTELVGADGVLCQLAADTPFLGSAHQELHRDTQLLFPETGVETPPYQLAVNVPLVDVTAENGPLEYAPGTHMLSKAEGMARIARGEIALEPLFLNRGDVLIRDVRHIHRGTPNRTAVPRPMVVIGYSRRWLNRPEVSIQVPRAVLARLPERSQRWLRLNPLVEDAATAAEAKETYRAFAY